MAKRNLTEFGLVPLRTNDTMQSPVFSVYTTPLQVKSRQWSGHHDEDTESLRLRHGSNGSSTRRHHHSPSQNNPSRPSPAGSSTSLQRGGVVDHSQMNHVGPPQPRRTGPGRRSASATPIGSTSSLVVSSVLTISEHFIANRHGNI